MPIRHTKCEVLHVPIQSDNVYLGESTGWCVGRPTNTSHPASQFDRVMMLRHLPRENGLPASWLALSLRRMPYSTSFNATLLGAKPTYGSDWSWSSDAGLGAWNFSFRAPGRVGERRGGPLRFESKYQPSLPCLVPEIDDVLDFPKGRMRFQL
jgi:hypothetical protein